MIEPYLQRPFLQKVPFASKLAAISATLCFSCCLMLTLISYQKNVSIHASMLSQLGQELSEQLALSARAALVQGDSLSLQSLLVELTQSEHVSQAAIFNVENKPIAEAGERLGGATYTATIHYQDSIAGHSLITLKPDALHTQTTGLLLQQLLLGLLFSACCYAINLWLGGKLSTLFKQLQSLITAPNYPMNTRRKKIPYFGDDELAQLIQQVLKGPNPAAKHLDNTELALVHIEFQHLHTPLTDEHKAQLLTYHQQLSIVSKLYEGYLEISRANSFTALFYQHKNHNDHPFKALCCAKVIEQLFADLDESFSIKITASLTPNSDEFSKQNAINHCIELSQTHDRNLIVADNILNHASVCDRIQSKQDDDTNNITHDTIELDSAYSELINRQFSALQLQFKRS